MSPIIINSKTKKMIKILFALMSFTLFLTSCASNIVKTPPKVTQSKKILKKEIIKKKNNL